MTVGQRIKKARINAGLTQAQLAKKLDNIPFQGVSQWEREVRKPKFDTLVEIAKAVNVSVEYLLYGVTEEELSFELLTNSLAEYDFSVIEDNSDTLWCYVYPSEFDGDPTFIYYESAMRVPIVALESEFNAAVKLSEQQKLAKKQKKQYVQKCIEKMSTIDDTTWNILLYSGDL